MHKHLTEQQERQGFIKLYRSLLDSRVFANPELLKVWLWCLLKVRHKKGWAALQQGKGQTEVEVLRGEFILGRHQASEELQLSPSSIYRLLKKLQSMGNIKLASKGNYSMVQVLKFDEYQSLPANHQASTSPAKTGGTASPAEKLLAPDNSLWLEQLTMNQHVQKDIREIITDYSLKLEERGEGDKDLKQLRAGLQRHIIFWKKRRQRFDQRPGDEPAVKTIPKTWYQERVRRV